MGVCGMGVCVCVGGGGGVSGNHYKLQFLVKLFRKNKLERHNYEDILFTPLKFLLCTDSKDEQLR